VVSLVNVLKVLREKNPGDASGGKALWPAGFAI
jgi:hypothetical protein